MTTDIPIKNNDIFALYKTNGSRLIENFEKKLISFLFYKLIGYKLKTGQK